MFAISVIRLAVVYVEIIYVAVRLLLRYIREVYFRLEIVGSLEEVIGRR